MQRKPSGWLSAAMIISLTAAVLCSNATAQWTQQNVTTREWSMWGMASVGTQWGIPTLFTCLCAALFSMDLPYSQFVILRQKLPRALLMTAVWWTVCAAVWMQTNYPNEMDTQTFAQCLSEVLEDPVNMTVLLALSSSVLLYPLLWRVLHQRTVRRYCLLLFFLFSFLLPLLKLVPYLSAVTMLTDQLNWGYFTSWGFYVLLAGEILLEDLKPWPRTFMLCGGILAFALSYAATSWSTDIAPGFFSDYIGIASPMTALQTAAVLTLAKTVFRRLRPRRLERFSFVSAGCLPAAYLAQSILQSIPAVSTDHPAAGIGISLLAVLLACLFNASLLQIPGFRLLTGSWLMERSNA